MERRMIVALVISFLVLGFYPTVLKYFYPSYGKAPIAAKTDAQKSPVSSSETAKATNSAFEAFSPASDKAYQSARHIFTFNEASGGIRQIAFPKYIDSETAKPLEFVALSSDKYSVTSLRVKTSDDPDAKPLENIQVDVAGSGVITVTGQSGSIRAVKQYQFESNRYDGILKVRLENTSQTPVNLSYDVIVGPSIHPRHSIDGQYIEGNFYETSESKKKLRHIKESKLGKIVKSEAPIEWIASKDRHFSIILKPATKGALFDGYVQGLGNHEFGVWASSLMFNLAAGQSIEQEFVFYCGPNEMNELEPVGLDSIINFGKLDGIGRFLIGSLELMNKIFKNYGLSIIALTLLINLLFFPLTRVSYMSMKRMQLVQPQVKKLQDQYKNNPQKLNKEMMELYRKHKVNPFGGCLPMLLQMPIFIALYVALSKAVGLINSRFLWATDLSSPDTVHLPVALPFLGDQLHILPLIMMVGMFVQQKFTQIKMEGQDPAIESQQKMMAFMMPIMFGFIFYSMPAGLVLYWLTNTAIMTLYQLSLKKMTPA